MDNSVKRGDIFYADLSPVVGSEQGGVRPVLIVQNDTGNRHSPTVIAAAITSQTGKARLPTHISLLANTVCTATTLLDFHRIPRQIIIDDDIGELLLQMKELERKKEELEKKKQHQQEKQGLY